jgi:WD40 repeat protein
MNTDCPVVDYMFDTSEERDHLYESCIKHVFMSHTKEVCPLVCTRSLGRSNGLACLPVVAQVYSVAFSPNGLYLASCSRDKTARVYEMKTCSLGVPSYVTALARLLISSGARMHRR